MVSIWYFFPRRRRGFKLIAKIAGLIAILLANATFGFLARTGLALSPEDLLVVYNQNLKDSKAVAEHYALKRGVPATNLIGVNVSATEHVTRSEFEKNLMEPLRNRLDGENGRSSGPSLLLVYGLPLKVSGTNERETDLAFTRLAEEKAKEYRSLINRLVEELDRLASSAGRIQPPPVEGGETVPTDLLRKSGESMNRAVKLLEMPSSSPQEDKTKAAVYSLLVKLAGLSPAAKVYLEERARLESEKGRGSGWPELMRITGVLRLELEEHAFRGLRPEAALNDAATIRLLDGLVGEYKFWAEAHKIYAQGFYLAAVDSELAKILSGPYQLPLWLPNPFLAAYDRLPFISELRSRTVRVGRLDGPTPSAARRLVDDAVGIEETGLQGTFYIDARGLKSEGKSAGVAWYDRHLIELHRLVKERSSFPVVLDDRSALFPPGSCPDAALYCGWYSLRKYVPAFTWRKGAVGFHVASAEASTLKLKDSQVWCKRMIEDGVAATLGPVAEPYLHSFPRPDHFFPLLMTGQAPLLEVYYRTIPHVSWRQVLIGDPLYTPFKTNPAWPLKPSDNEPAPESRP
ncbi:MAG: TIGR03790 family protein [Thermodesulfobacteriota bacterium]